jgi:molybdate transport system substrate-binding protein
MIKISGIKWLLSMLLIFVSTVSNAQDKVTIFAAASLTNAISDMATHYEKDQSVQIQTSFASSSTLAKQIEKGAPADIYMSADSKWMNYLQDKNLLKVDSKVNLLGNQLVLIAPKGRVFKVDMDKRFNIAGAFSGKLCTGELDSVPVGIYAKQSLKSLNWWDATKMRIVGTQDVRAALVFVERGECDAGIVYATDAKVSSKVEIIAIFPETSHDPIVYPLALLKGASPVAVAFYDYLKSDKAKVIFSQYGFSVNVY